MTKRGITLWWAKPNIPKMMNEIQHPGAFNMRVPAQNRTTYKQDLGVLGISVSVSVIVVLVVASGLALTIPIVTKTTRFPDYHYFLITFAVLTFIFAFVALPVGLVIGGMSGITAGHHRGRPEAFRAAGLGSGIATTGSILLTILITYWIITALSTMTFGYH